TMVWHWPAHVTEELEQMALGPRLRESSGLTYCLARTRSLSSPRRRQRRAIASHLLPRERNELENGLTFRSRDLERRLQRSRRLAWLLSQRVRKLAQLRLGRRDRLRLDCAVGLDQVLPERRERGAAALRTARLGGDDRLAEALVHVINQEPGAAIGHVERATRLRDRAGPADGLQEPDLAGAQGPLGAEIDPHRQPNVAHWPPRAGEWPQDYHVRLPVGSCLNRSGWRCLHEPCEQAGEACSAQRQIALLHQPA